MCRLFAIRSEIPASLADSLCGPGTSLAEQSHCDARGESHGDGWGIATYESGQPIVERSTLAAFRDQHFTECARTLRTRLALAHVRQASVGNVAIENTHPFDHGPWAFMHNGTLQNFRRGRQRLLEATAEDLRGRIRGVTDSEHAFYFWLGKLRAAADSRRHDGAPALAVDGANERKPAVRQDRESAGGASVEDFRASLGTTVLELAEWFPSHDNQETRLNFVVTDGRLLAATRWKHSLHWLEQDADRLREGATRSTTHPENGRTILLASQPTISGAWREVPDRSIIVIDENLRVHVESV